MKWPSGVVVGRTCGRDAPKLVILDAKVRLTPEEARRVTEDAAEAIDTWRKISG